jgi:NAD(P)-dependent dehydrogenase (short-subunit alcohol dehydrogenase family)
VINLSGKTALVTGASRGIGRASALALAKAGAQVPVNYGRRADEAAAVVKEIRVTGGRADAIGADLSAPDGPHKLAKEVRAIVGARLDILVANAGASKAASIEDYTVVGFRPSLRRQCPRAVLLGAAIAADPARNHRSLVVRPMHLKNGLRQIKPNCANFIHGRLLFSGVSTPPLWHIDAVRGRPPHRFPPPVS